MDNAQAYAWAVFAVALVATVLRFARARSFALDTSSRMEAPRQRAAYSITAGLAMFAAIGLVIVSFSTLFPLLFWIGAAIAFLSGLQMLLSVIFRSPEQLVWVARIIGSLFAVVTVFIYLYLVR